MLAGLTIRGRCLLAAGVAATACALVLDERDLLRIAVFIAAMPLLALVLTARTRFTLNAQREITPMRVPVGSDASVRVQLRGGGYLPTGGVRLEDGVPPALGGRPLFHLREVPRRGGMVLEYTVRPELRGIHHIGPLRVRIHDPLGLAEFERELGGRGRLVARPRVVPLGGLPIGSGRGDGDAGSRRLRPGHGEDDSMVRQYRHGDDIRRIHWKSTAHRDELMVRAEERPWHGGVAVLVDRRSAAHRGSGPRSSLEWAISATASICLHLHNSGRSPRLVTEDGEPLSGGPADGIQSSDSMLDALAAVRPSTQRDLVCGSDPGQGRELIAVLGATTAVGVAELTRLRPEGARSLAVLLDVRAWHPEGTDGGFDPAVTMRRLRAAGWTVVVVPGPRASMAEVWANLCQSARYTGVAS